MPSRIPALGACFLLFAGAVSIGAERVTLTGKVVDRTGKPVERATVMVYHAGVKVGYSLYCPSCYADCGKRAMTDAKGSFTIRGLASDLWFELLVVRDGYVPASLQKVDPSRGPAKTAVLMARPKLEDPVRVVRGRVVNVHGTPVRDAVVQPQTVEPRREDGRGTCCTLRDMDPIAVTNTKGEFEIACAKPAAKVMLSVEARGMAPKFFKNVPMGTEWQTMTVTDGATVRGRLVQTGKPVGGAEIGLFSRDQVAGNGNSYDEFRIGTNQDGSFVFTNVPAPAEWYVYGKMESIAKRGAALPVVAATRHDNEDVDVGDIEIKPGHTLRGKVVLSDGKPIPEGMRVILSSACIVCSAGYVSFALKDSQTTMLAPDGRFEFVGLASGPYQLTPSVKGYGLAADPQVLLPLDDGTMAPNERQFFERANRPHLKAVNATEVRVDRDISGLEIVLDPVRGAGAQH